MLKMERLEELCIDALLTDGAHHKQWYIEQILEIAIGCIKFDKAKKHIGWDDGIAP